MLRAVLFDLDDTLLPDEAAADAAILVTAAHARAIHNLAPDDLRASVRRIARERFRAHPAVSNYQSFDVSSWEALSSSFAGADAEMTALRAWAPRYRFDVWYDALAENGVADVLLAGQLACIYPEERRARYVAYPDVLPLLAELDGRYRLGIVTNGPCDLQCEKLDRSGLATRFPVRVISREVGVMKPDPRIFAIALERLGVGAAGSVMVGDSLRHDVAGARAAGIRSVWLNRDRSSSPTPDIRPDWRISSLAELPPLLANL